MWPPGKKILQRLRFRSRNSFRCGRRAPTLHVAVVEKPNTQRDGTPPASRAIRVRIDHSARRALPLLMIALLLTSCEREVRRFRDNPSSPKGTAALSELYPGTVPPHREKGPYDDEAWSVSEGQRNFQWFNCSGCHSNGGGGIGPALMDEKWIYGGAPENIFASIIEGRPNGMPSFRGRIPDQQVWQLVAYVRSLSGQLRKDVEPGRSDSLNGRPAPQSTSAEQPRQSE